MEYDIESGWTAWIATRRKNIAYHRVGTMRAGQTKCGRSTRTGAFVTQWTLTDLDAKSCPKCYPRPGRED